MIPKLDRLILRAFVGPFLATFSVLVFIFLIQFVMKYIDELLGKDLGIEVYGELFGYFALFMFPQAMPLAILLASLITYGSLGEHNELAAIKSAGISLTRILRPIGVVVLGLSFLLFWFNDQVLPKASLKAFSLLYDIRTKKVALDIQPKQFYYGLPGFSVRVNDKDPKDKELLKDVIIYDHSEGNGNNKIVLAKMGRMKTIYDDRYLVLELYQGKNFTEVSDKPNSQEFVVNSFDTSRFIFNLSSFDLNRTNIDLFRSNRLFRNLSELTEDKDSIAKEKVKHLESFKTSLKYYSNYEIRSDTLKTQIAKAKLYSSASEVILKRNDQKPSALSIATNQARSFKSFVESTDDRSKDLRKEFNSWSAEYIKRFSSPVACLVLFLIGAPIGSIIRKGGLGVPVLISLFFFILYYVLSTTGEKNAKESVWQIEYAMWAANVLLGLLGLFFLRQAFNDASLFEIEFYTEKFRRLIGVKSSSPKMIDKEITSLEDLDTSNLA